MLKCDDIALVEEYMNQKLLAYASATFVWERSGTSPSGIWLLNDTVPSNVTGRHIFLKNGSIKKIFVSNEAVNTFTLGIYEHDGTTYTLLTTVAISALRKYEASLNVSITYNKELAIKIESGSGKNIVCGLLPMGDLA